MRRLAGSLFSFFPILLFAAVVAAEGAAAGKLEAVSILTGRSGSSVALHASALVPLIATSAADSHTLVIELVGVSADRRERTFPAAAGIISRVTVDPVAEGHRVLTRIKVSLTRPFRHQVRVSGNLIYVDLVRRDEESLLADRGYVEAKRRLPSRPNVASPAARGDVTALPRPSEHLTAAIDVSGRLRALTDRLQRSLSSASAILTATVPWFPLRLRDGSMIYSYGEMTEVDNRLVFLVPLDPAPTVQSVSLLSSAVDVEATRQAVGSIRAARYVLTRGEEDFALLGEQVAAILHAVPAESDRTTRLGLLGLARRQLVEWPAQHYWYRSTEIIEAIRVIDEVLIQLQPTGQVPREDVSLVAVAKDRLSPPQFREPTLIDLIESAIRIVPLVDIPEERTAVLRATANALEQHGRDLPSALLSALRPLVTARLGIETRIDDAYRELTTRTMRSAVNAADAGNPRPLYQLQADLLARHRQLGAKRPETIAATVNALQAQLARAAQMRLRLDKWEMDLPSFRGYAAGIARAVKRFEALKPGLEKIAKGRTHVDASVTLEARETLDFVSRVLKVTRPPAELAEAHVLLLEAARLAAVIVPGQFDERVPQGKEPVDKADAAAKAIASFDRGRQAVDDSLKPPARPRPVS